MAHDKAYQRSSYPLPAYNFRVTIGETTLGFAEVSGLEVRRASVTYLHGLSFLEGESIVTFPRKSFIPMEMKRGLVLGASPLFLQEWLVEKDLRCLTVDLCDEKGDPALSWRVPQAVPVKLAAPTLDASGQNVAIEELELRVRGVQLKKI